MSPEELPEFSTFEELSAIVGGLWNEGQPQRAIEILERAKDRFPDRQYDMIFSLGYSYLLIGDHENALLVLEEGLESGFWFVFPLETPVIRPLVGLPRFQRIVAESERMRGEAQAQCKPRSDVVTPEGYSSESQYPLFIALHGWGETNQVFMEYWTSDLLRTDFLAAFMESSQLVKMDGGRGWDNVTLGREEITRLYHDLTNLYPIDETRIVMGGFSQGGRMAVDIAIGGVLPVSGFAVLCPGGGIPKSLTPEGLQRAQDEGLRGTILTGEHDPDLPDQKQMTRMFDDGGLDARLVVNAGLGHWFPENFGEQLDRAIRHVFEK
jgi:predicted esterase